MSDFGPLYTGRPRAITQLNNKYGNPSTYLSSLSNPIAMRLQALDMGRANLGQSPLTQRETQVAGTAATEHQTAPQMQADQPWWKDALGDIQTIAGSIPKIPSSLAEEALNLPSLPSKYQALQNQGTLNPLEYVGGVAQLPGVRLLPGSFTASQFAKGGQGIGGLTEHPVFTAMDVLPYAEKGLSYLPSYEAAQQAAAGAAEIQGTLPQRVTPIGAFVKHFPYGESDIADQMSRITPGKDVPTLPYNAVGRALTATQRLAPEGIGNFFRQGFSAQSHNEARVQSRFGANQTMTQGEGGVALPGFEEPLTRAAAFAKNQGGVEAVNALEQKLSPAEVEQVWQARAGNPEDIAKLSPQQEALRQEFRAQNAPFEPAAVAADRLSKLTINGVEDYYDKAFGDRVEQARTELGRRQAVQYLRDDLNPKTPNAADPATLIDHFRTAMADETISKGARVQLARGYAQALENNGYDVTPVRQALDTVKKSELAGLPDTVPSIPTRDVLTRARGSEDWYGKLKNVKASTRDSQKAFTPGQLRQAQQSLDTLETHAVPTKFEPAVTQEFEKRVTAAAQTKFAGQPQKWEQFQSLMDNGYAYPELEAMMPEEWKAIKDDVRTIVPQLREAGWDPTFTHEVHPSLVHQFDFPKVTSQIPDLAQFKSRMFDPQPSEHSFTVSLNHRAGEILDRAGRQAYVDQHLIPLMSRPESYLRDTMMPAALASGQPVDSLMQRDWTRFSPGDYVQTGQFKAPSTSTADQLWIPKDVAANLKKLSTMPSDLARTGEKAIKPFRTAVVNLSPRVHAGNIIGGGIMTTLSAENPIKVWMKMPEAFGMARRGELQELAMDPTLTDAERAAAMRAPGGQAEQIKFNTGTDPVFQSKLVNEIKNAAPKEATEKSWATLAGDQMGHYFQQAVPEFLKAWDSPMGKILRSGFNWVTAKSLWANELFDNMYRGMKYLEGKENALNKGMTKEEAINAGVKSMRDTLQNFDTMTPLERTTMRYVMPFWSWARTAMHYALTYPGDHPWRMSIISNLAKAEAEDFNTGLPQYMKSWLFLGPTKQDGTVKAINLDTVNPFKDVANYFTLGGFLANGEGGGAGITSNLNPLLATALQQFGVDTMSGESQMFPQTAYNPTTGRIEALPKEGTISNFVGNLLPQARLLEAVTGQSNTFKELLRRNPAAASRSLWSAAGMPINLVPRNVDVPTETMKAELTRYGAFKQDVKNQMQAGNVSGLLEKYPGLDAFRTRLEALSPTEAAKYNATPGMAGAYNPGYGELFSKALTGG